MTRTLDVYVRAHGSSKKGIPCLESNILEDIGSNKNIALYFYSPDKSTLKGRAADLIFLRGAQSKTPPHLKYGTDVAPVLITNIEIQSSPCENNNFVPTEIPNYSINWNPGGNWVTGIMVVNKDENHATKHRYKRVWLPQIISELRNIPNLPSSQLVYFDHENIRSLKQLIQMVKNPSTFLGKSSQTYSQINIHWTMCREAENEVNIKVDLRNYKGAKNYAETLDREFFRTISDLKKKLDNFRPSANIRSSSLPVKGTRNNSGPPSNVVET
jgi:hypothetical protein